MLRHKNFSIYCDFNTFHIEIHLEFDYLKTILTKNNGGALRDLVLFVKFKKPEKHPWRSVTFSKVPGFSLQLYEKEHSSMGVFHVF